jgi:hypothetical protein
MKTSPFYTGSMIAGKTSSGKIVRWDDPKSVKIEKLFAHKLETQMDNERIYIWPLFYKNFLMYSILWPLAEINDVGWEFRPFISVDNYAAEYRILTGGWNSKQASNYIFPLYSKTKDNFISLPFSTVKDDQYNIYNFMLLGGYFSRDNSSYCAPLYYYNGTKGQLYSLICSFAKDNGYILPLYFYNYQQLSGKSISNHIILPFGYVNTTTELGGDKILEALFLPLFYYREKFVTNHFKNPKYRDKKFSFPNQPKDFWLKKQSMKKNLWLIPTIFLSSNQQQEQQSKVLFPLYFAGHNKAKNWLTIFPLYFSAYGSDYNWRTIFPIYFAGYNKNETWMTLFPLCFTGSGKKSDWITIFPIYFSGYNKTTDEDWFSIFPFYTSSRKQKNHYKNYGIIAGTRDKNLLNKTYHSSYLLPFYNYNFHEISRSRINPKYVKKDIPAQELPKDFLETENTVAQSNFYFPNIFTSNYKNHQAASTTYFPFYFNGYDKMLDCDSEWFSIFPFYTYNRDHKNISKNYGLLAGTKKQFINDKFCKSSYLLPFYAMWYAPETRTRLNPRYRGQKIKYNKRPADYYTTETTIVKKSFFFPSIYSSHNSERQEDYFTFFPFISHKNNHEFSKTGSFFSLYQRKAYHHSEDLTTNLLWFFYYFNKRGDKTTEYLFPSYYSYEDKRRHHKVNNLFPFIFHTKNDQFDSWGSLLWFYTSRNHLLKGECETQALWYLYYNYQRTADKAVKRETYESSRVLWKVYHRETRGKNTNIDIFPFISYSQNSKRTKLSFAYRFFSISKSKKTTKIHLLFIPVWW